jgi:4a-hydroxytetrahydrobiopterin dehydratase
MEEDDVRRYLENVPGWGLSRDGQDRLERTFEHDDFSGAMHFVNAVADLADDEGHHPDVCIHYDRVDLTLTTHAAGGLTENDFIMAAKIDEL